MKTTKRFFAALLAAGMALALAACNKGGIIESEEDFQKNMHQSDYYRLSEICETEDGYYFLMGGSDAIYFEKETGQATILCTKPDCSHDSDTCDGRIVGDVLWATGGRLYYTNSTLLEEHGKLVDHGERIYSAALDGTRRKVVMDLEFEPSGSSTYVNPILHRGYVYFFYSGVFYRAPLGGKLKSTAQRLWGEEIAGETGRVHIYDSIPVGNSFTLWADGDFVYFMVNVKQADGTYKDTLFAFDTTVDVEKSDGELVRQVWETPDADTVGEWTETGVSVSQWYVKDGYIYFYLSGGDFWRCSLETGDYELLAETHEKTLYGKAVFSDEYMCLLNAEPEDKSLPGFVVAEEFRYDYNSLVGGDTFYLYGLDGKLVKTLPLDSVFEQFEDVENIEPLFCGDGEVWFVAEAVHSTGEMGTPQEGFLPFGGVKTYDYIVCRLNIDTGEIAEVYREHRE